MSWTLKDAQLRKREQHSGRREKNVQDQGLCLETCKLLGVPGGGAHAAGAECSPATPGS